MSSSEPDFWKKKYLDLLDTLEQEQTDRAEDEKNLRQALTRLGLAVDTQDLELTTQIEALRKTIRGRGTIAQIQRLMEDISASILRLDKDRGIERNIQTALEQLEHRLESFQLPNALRKPMRAFKKDLAAAGKAADPLAALNVYASLVTSVVDWLVVQPAEEKPGLLDRLLSHTPSKTAEPEASTDAAPDTGCPADDHNATTAQRPASPPFNQVLFDLMNRLHVPMELTTQAQRIRDRLNDRPSEELATASVVEIADLMARSRQQVEQEKQDIEQFLTQLTDQLQALDRELDNTAGNRERASAEGNVIDASMSAEVANIRRSVAEAQDIGNLKSEIRAHLDNIQQHMDKRKELEQYQLEQAEAQIVHLREALTQVESESQDLRERLHEARERALHDALTGLHNRLAYDERIEQECERWARYHRPTVVSIWDIDHFKRINDTFGHAAGDNALRSIAKLLQELTRKSDFIARFGGEEFMLLLPETDIDTALELADRLRERVASKRFQYRGKPVPLSISCGLAAIIEGDTPESVYHRADQALYQAKASGRNRCVVFSADMPITHAPQPAPPET